jgi:hypothetical protein
VSGGVLGYKLCLTEIGGSDLARCSIRLRTPKQWLRLMKAASDLHVDQERPGGGAMDEFPFLPKDFHREGSN